MRVFPACLATLSALVLLGCGDQETSDNRGYTKAPLENPGLTIEHRDRHELREFGRPLLPEAREITLEESAPSTN